MSTSIKTAQYVTLVNDITELYNHARHALVEAYWQIGRRIVELEQQGETNATYGDRLLVRLSEDLSESLGGGFSRRNVYNMRQFYLTYKEIVQVPAQLTWTQHVELLPIKKASDRRKLERLAIKKKWSHKQIRQAVQEVNQLHCDTSEIFPSEGPPAVIPSLGCTRKPLHGYALVDQTNVQYPKGFVVVDCGFNVWRTLPGREPMRLGEASYTYPATVESVIDGDTLWAVIDCGFNTSIREKLRFRGIDAPELGTPEGDRTRQYVRRTLKACPTIVIQTHKNDKYDRYLSDIFYLPGCTDPVQIGREGHFLNQTLLDKGLAQAWKP